MISISEQLLEQLIREDVPYFDLTTHALGIGGAKGRISFATCADTVLCCTEEAAGILQRAGAQVTLALPTGSKLEPAVTFLCAQGNAGALHLAWKAAQNLLEYACGVATKTNQLVRLAQAASPEVMLYTTRKSVPGTKPVAVKAILAGGAYPHRLGLSETVLIFDQHLNFTGGIEGFLQQLPALKRKVKEKKVIVELKETSQAVQLAEAGVDGIQFDKIDAPELLKIIPALKSIHPAILTLAAGGISESNIAQYAATGADGLVLTAPYYAKPADIRVELLPV
ncbi:ModD protein [Kamptonema formosum]|uniref:ModD protein n=1 Tax=Kamptonema formosum TaxID=331992 RepID=UPI00034711A1|nr:ModD protein [Oscillatoria sp. PCC 10802]